MRSGGNAALLLQLGAGHRLRGLGICRARSGGGGGAARRGHGTGNGKRTEDVVDHIEGIYLGVAGRAQPALVALRNCDGGTRGVSAGQSRGARARRWCLLGDVWLERGLTVGGLQGRNEALEVVRPVAVAIAEHDIVALVAVEPLALGAENLPIERENVTRSFQPSERSAFALLAHLTSSGSGALSRAMWVAAIRGVRPPRVSGSRHSSTSAKGKR